MNKLLSFALAAALVSPVFAQEDDSLDEIFEAAPVAEAPRKKVGVWPAFFAVCNIPSPERTPDVIGLRLTIPFSTGHESVTGFDVGFWGEAQYFEGFMLNVLRNKVNDQFTGLQVGLYNTANQADMLGVQVGLWNEAGSILGIQAGIINTAGIAHGLQVGLINRAEEMYGFQVGVINVIRDAEIQFCPVVNIGF